MENAEEKIVALLDVLVTSAIGRMNRAAEMANAAQDEYMDACQDFRWEDAEHARERALGHFEAFMDQVAAANKLLEVSRGDL